MPFFSSLISLFPRAQGLCQQRVNEKECLNFAKEAPQPSQPVMNCCAAVIKNLFVVLIKIGWETLFGLVRAPVLEPIRDGQMRFVI